MSGTGASLVGRGGGGLILPAPKVQFITQAKAGNSFFVSQDKPSSPKLTKVSTLKNVVVTFPGISSEILDNAQRYKPLLELLRYRPVKTRSPASNGGRGNKKAGYAHPSNAPEPSGNASFTHGGGHQDASADIIALRQTEWPIAQSQDRFDVTQGILSFMCYGTVLYRNAVGLSSLSAIYPATKSGAAAYTSGRRFPYSRAFQPGYFAFRLSILDLQDDRKKRVHGPLSDKISVSNSVFPFIPDGVNGQNQTVATLAANFDPFSVNFWMAGASRLPG